MLVVSDLRRPGLGPLSFQLASGECLAVMGPSGAGKTLLLRAIADLDPNEGAVSLDGRSREDFTGPEWRYRVAYVPAEPGWWAERLPVHFRDWPTAASLAASLLVDPGVAERPISQLSTGERQRLALVRALERAPSILLLDEPTGPLDQASTSAVEALLKEQCDKGTAMLWVTHDAAQASRVASRHLCLAGGRLEKEAA